MINQFIVVTEIPERKKVLVNVSQIIEIEPIDVGDFGTFITLGVDKKYIPYGIKAEESFDNIIEQLKNSLK